MDQAIRGLFRPLEEYADPSILTVDCLCFVSFSGCTRMLECSSESACLPFVARDVYIVIWILLF
jgi:hypothetical protein